MKYTLAVIFFLFFSHPAATQTQPAADSTSTKISAYFFGDYFYNAVRDNDHKQITSNRVITGDVGSSAFQIRRMNLTLDHKLDKKITTRLRLEGENESFTGNGRSAAFLKDVYVEWLDLFEGHSLTIGLQSNPMIDYADRYWENRHIEKTIGDYRGFFSSRDLGVSLAGNLIDGGKLSYKLLFGNRSALKTEDNNSKSFQLTLHSKPAGNLSVMFNTEFVNYGAMMVSAGTAQTEYSNYQYSGHLLVDYSEKGAYSVTAEGIYAVRKNGDKIGSVYYDRNSLAFSLHGRYFFTPTLNAALRFDYFDVNSLSDFGNDSRTGYMAILNWKANKYITISPNVMVENYEELASGNKYRPSVTGRITFNCVLIP